MQGITKSSGIGTATCGYSTSLDPKAPTINYSALSSGIHHGCLYRWNDHSRSAQGHSWASHSPGSVLPNLQLCACLLYHLDSSTHQLPPSPQLHKPHLWRCPGFWKVPWSSGPGGLTAAVTSHWFPSTEENQASSLVGWDIPSIQTAKIDGTAVEGILKRPVPFQKITTWVF